MQPQDATAVYLFKLWPWIEKNKRRIVAGAGVVIAAIGIIFYFSSLKEQKEIDAGKALTDALLNGGAGQLPESLEKVSADYPSTLAGQRASLQAAAALFAAGRYADAQTQFKKFLDANPNSEYYSQASLGVAASLDAQGKSDLALGDYQQAINSPDVMTASMAKLAVARIYESQGKLNQAFTLYQDVARANPNGALGAEAEMRAAELKMKSQPPSTPATPANLFKLNP